MNHIVLIEPLIPENTGNIMRTCVATNTKLHLIKPLGFILDDKHLKRAGVNYIDKLDYEVHESFDDFDYTKDENIYLIFGKETTGIPKEILKNNLSTCIRMPMTKNVRALNLSNTCAIAIYEVLRQQNYNDLLFDEPHKDNFLDE